ncbi:MAG: histone deacetylase [Candidatus Aminicenantes bacterium]|jgi:acetoin utilization deacetylase AcuC-like enzyme|nr:histone deacetylase [Candidatus Aminicenantes bacterium]MDH5385220.1 histone deacetylase [Candidatus Aminicenantes bacterium]MDH5742571.1 histone deacetylase [Candidatus Aminicenantes bacterium]
MGRIRRLLQRVRRSKFPFQFIYSDAYWMVDLGNHVFPAEKYRLIYEKILLKGAKKEHFLAPESAQEEDILLVHTPRYLKKLKSGKLSQAEIMTMELPYTTELLDFAQLMVGGTITAARMAVINGLAVHIGGGFHHAFPDHGEGFCIFNDVAVALRKMQKEGLIMKGMVVDCDVHQGNGTAKVFSEDKSIFTFSMHQMDIYPAHKEESTLDVGLWSGDGDKKYLSDIKLHIPGLYEEFQPDIIFYLAGADPYEKDQLGGLKLTLEGLKERDRIVIGGALRYQIPIVILLAGGYAYDVEDTVAIHFHTIQVAQKLKRKKS